MRTLALLLTVAAIAIAAPATAQNTARHRHPQRATRPGHRRRRGRRSNDI